MKIGKRLIVIAISLLICMAFTYSVFAYPTVYPTGTTIYKPHECYNSWVLVTSFGTSTPLVYLMDMNGNIVHRWPGVRTGRARLLPNGNLLTINEKGTGPPPQKTNLLEYDWEGNIVWKWEPPSMPFETSPHHDVRRLPNGNTLTIISWAVPKDLIKTLKDVNSPWFGEMKRSMLPNMVGDRVVEINPKGEIVWDWMFHEHLDLNRFSPICQLADWTHTNTIQALPENPWYDAGDERFKPGNVLINPRNLDSTYLIDRDTKKVVWEWSHGYSGGTAHSHETEMIPKGLPGAGNIITFDNGLFPRFRDHCGQSFVIEINPRSKKMVWKYETVGYSNMRFFSKTTSTQQRLPNGNTFIVEANTGRLFQVKTQSTEEHMDGGEIVWEYMITDIPNHPLLPHDRITNPREVSRPKPYPYDYCPQLKAIYEKSRPPELAVTPPRNASWHLKPDVLR